MIILIDLIQIIRINYHFIIHRQDQQKDLYNVSSPNKTDEQSIAKIETTSTHISTGIFMNKL